MLDHMPQVNFKVKGLLKGLRYISQVFDGEKEEEEEMQIGHPTDVKHVAHIGWDGSSVSNPTWMNDFGSGDGKESTDSTSQVGGVSSSPSHDTSDSPKRHRRARRHSSSETVGSDDSSSRGTRHSRKHQSTGSAPGSESSDGSRRGRRHSKPENSSKPDSESPARDIPTVPKKFHHKKRTGKGSDGGSSHSSIRSKEPGTEDSITRPIAVEEVA